MPDDITTDRETFKALAEALCAYLEAVGWRAIVVGNPRIQQQPDAASEMHYEFVVRFTGGRKRAAAPEEK